MKAAIILTALASWYLVGLSVTVGLVVYPSFSFVGAPEWPAFHRHHVARIAWAVGGAWAAQALGLVWWLVRRHGGISTTWWWCAAGATVSVLITATSALRLHDQLHSAFDPQVARALVRMHWLRTASWLVAAVAVTVGLSSQ